MRFTSLLPSSFFLHFLLPLPPRPGRGILEQDTPFLQLVPDAIRSDEVSTTASCVSVFDATLDLLHRDRRPLIFTAAQRQHAEHIIEALERRSNRRQIAAAQPPGVNR